jgi:hypothetical protein
MDIMVILIIYSPGFFPGRTAEIFDLVKILGAIDVPIGFLHTA